MKIRVNWWLKGCIMRIDFMLNNKPVSIDVPGMTRLLDVLREEFHLTGTKEGCGEGECGACTVIVNGKAVNSCLIPSCQVQNASVITIEGLKHDNKLKCLQQAFYENGAVQCGFCTPGIIMASKSLLDNHPSADKSDVKEALSGHYCRCISHYQVVDAVMDAAQKGTGKGNQERGPEKGVD